MSGELRDWEKVTPQHLRPAIEHIRNSFESGHWRYGQITSTLAHAALHSPVSDPASLSPYQRPFEVYRQMVGRTAVREFDELLRQGTPPAIFRAYFDLYYAGLKINVRDEFDRTLKVALANSEALEIHPVEWAKLQLELLVKGEVRSVERWIKEVCDTQEMPEPEAIEEEFKELIFWTKWRAPRLIHMQPAGNTRYDAATSWTREDETLTQQLLAARSHRLVEFLEITLEKLAGDAHVLVAQNRDLKVRRHLPESPTDPQPSDAPQKQRRDRAPEPKSSAPLSSYRSELKRAILMQITRNPSATDLEVCRGLDADGAVELPSRWKDRASDRLFTDAYSRRDTRRKVETAISKIRADLRNKGLLDLG